MRHNVIQKPRRIQQKGRPHSDSRQSASSGWMPWWATAAFNGWLLTCHMHMPYVRVSCARPLARSLAVICRAQGVSAALD